MSDNYIKNVVEAALLAAGRPLQLTELAQLFDENARPELPALREVLGTLEADYGSRGIEVKETGSGFRIQVRKEMANEVSRLWPERPPKYSRALLETLALIAYRQPITRGEIEAVRGVAVNPNIIKTVIERNWVRVVGTRDVPGRPELLGTTKDFLDYFGLRALDELPPLAELKAMGEINLQLDLAKPTDPGSDDGSGSSGASGAGEGGSTSGTPDDSSAAAASADSQNDSMAASAVAVAASAVAAAAVVDASEASASDNVEAHDSLEAGDNLESNSGASAATEGLSEVATADTAATPDDVEPEPLVALTADVEADVAANAEIAAEADEETHAVAEAAAAADTVADADEPASAAPDSLSEVATADTAATPDDAVAEPSVAVSHEEFVAYEHDPHSVTITHVDIESDPSDVTVEVEALTFVEQQLENEARARDTSIETGEFEMSELGMTTKPAVVIEAEFEVEDISSAQSDEDDAADDEEELSAGPQSSTELVAAPRDRDD